MNRWCIIIHSCNLVFFMETGGVAPYWAFIETKQSYRVAHETKKKETKKIWRITQASSHWCNKGAKLRLFLQFGKSFIYANGCLWHDLQFCIIVGVLLTVFAPIGGLRSIIVNASTYKFFSWSIIPLPKTLLVS